jgi:hypothetical protein
MDLVAEMNEPFIGRSITSMISPIRILDSHQIDDRSCVCFECSMVISAYRNKLILLTPKRHYEPRELHSNQPKLGVSPFDGL